MTFQPGKSGNPGGRPKHTPEMREALDLANAALPDAVRKLIALMGNADPKVAMVASNSIIDRVLGKAAQPIVGDEDRAPLQVDDLAGLPRELRLKLQAKMLEALQGG